MTCLCYVTHMVPLRTFIEERDGKRIFIVRTNIFTKRSGKITIIYMAWWQILHYSQHAHVIHTHLYMYSILSWYFSYRFCLNFYIFIINEEVLFLCELSQKKRFVGKFVNHPHPTKLSNFEKM